MSGSYVSLRVRMKEEFFEIRVRGNSSRVDVVREDAVSSLGRVSLCTISLIVYTIISEDERSVVAQTLRSKDQILLVD
jgi:hypothetical protein